MCPLPSYTWQCGLKCTDKNLQTLQGKNLSLSLENFIRAGISSVMGDKYVVSDDNKKRLYIDANNLHGLAMSQSLPHDEINFDKNVNLEVISNTPDSSDIGFFVEVDLSNPVNKKGKTKNFQVSPDKKVVSKNWF